jgi:hypothetical protein
MIILFGSKVPIVYIACLHLFYEKFLAVDILELGVFEDLGE